MPAFSAVDCVDVWIDHLHAYPPAGLTPADHHDLEQLVSAARALASHVDRQVVMRDEDERTYLIIALARLMRRYAERHEGGRQRERSRLNAVRHQALELEDRIREAFPGRPFPDAPGEVLLGVAARFELPPPERMPGQLGLF